MSLAASFSNLNISIDIDYCTKRLDKIQHNFFGQKSYFTFLQELSSLVLLSIVWVLIAAFYKDVNDKGKVQKTSSQAPSYASPKLWLTYTYSLTDGG